MRTLPTFIALFLILAIAACNSAQFAGQGNQKPSSSRSSGQEAAHELCHEGTDDCELLSCSDILKLEDSGLVPNADRIAIEEAIASCKHRGSRDSQKLVRDASEESEDGIEEKSENCHHDRDHSSDAEPEDCP